VKLTDSGRTMYGGGGITPDVKLAPSSPTNSGDAAAALRVLQFRKRYVIGHKVTQSFEADETVLQDSANSWTKRRCPSPSRIDREHEWLRSNIRANCSWILRAGRRPEGAGGNDPEL